LERNRIRRCLRKPHGIESIRRSVGRRALAAALCALLAGASGCTLIELRKVREVEERGVQYATISGTVRSNHPDTEWIVVYISTIPCDADWKEAREIIARGDLAADPASWSEETRAFAQKIGQKAQIADHVVLQRPGFWYVQLAPGCYGVGAFADLDRNYKYNDEPVASTAVDPARLVELRPGDRHEGIELVIEPDARLLIQFDPVARQVREGGFRSHREQLLTSVGAVVVEGEVAALDDARFRRENGKLGYFEVYRFLYEARPGIYFLEPYDAKRTPVLFVHGALGYPQEFKALIEGLDRTRYQPWVFFYSSGGRLGPTAAFLSRSITALQLRHGFGNLAVVAHSMGGLIARDFILRHAEQVVDDPVRLFVSISTPWGGMASAASGVEKSPYVVPSWRDVAPRSDFMAQLFFSDPDTNALPRHPPEQVAFYMMFGVADETVSAPSLIRWETLRDARERWPLPYGHTAILRSPEASQLLGEILARELP
jgi:pimeloyl-ACP methyl ester carboxylesterase